MIRRAAAGMIALLTLNACHPAAIGRGRNGDDRAQSVTSRLVCAPRQGELALTEATADGQSCRYAGDDQRIVELRYLPLNGAGAPVALQGIERDLRTRLGAPGPRAGNADKTVESDDDDDDDVKPKPPAPPRRTDGHVSINLPGLHIDANDGGAHIRAFGETIDANEGGGAVVAGSWNGAANEIHANDDGVEMRFGFAGRQAVDMTFILTSSRPGPSGLRLVGYVARGPAVGPLVVATVTASNGGSHAGQNDFKDVAALVGKNVVK